MKKLARKSIFPNEFILKNERHFKFWSAFFCGEMTHCHLKYQNEHKFKFTKQNKKHHGIRALRTERASSSESLARFMAQLRLCGLVREPEKSRQDCIRARDNAF